MLDHTKKKVLGSYDSKDAANKRLKQIEYFKNQPAKHGMLAAALRIAKLRIASMAYGQDSVVPAIDIRPDIGLPPAPDPMIAVMVMLESRVVDAAALLQHIRQAHWNIKGDAFAALHQFFDQTYWQVASMLDRIAERLVAIGGYPDALLGETAPQHALPDYPTGITDQKDQLHAIAASLGMFAGLIRDGVGLAQQSGDELTSNLLVEVGTETEKLKWQTEAGLEGREDN